MKFLKGKVWAIALAIVALVAVLCVTAFGADTEPSATTIYISGGGITVQRGQTRCYKNTDPSASYALTEISKDAEDYNVKVTYPADGTPIVYLKGAYVGTFSNHADTITEVPSKTTVIIEKTETGTVTAGSSVKQADTYISGEFKWKGGELVIEGVNDSKLQVYASTTVTNQALTYKNLNLTVSYGTPFVGTPTMITFSGGTADITATYLGTNFTSGGDGLGGFTITDNAVVNWTSTNQVFYAPSCNNIKVLVESGYLTATSQTASKSVFANWPANTGLVVKGGTVELFAGEGASVGIGMIDVKSYKNKEDQNIYSAVSGSDANNVTTHNCAGTTSGKRYLKIEAAYNVTVNGGTASPAPAPVGATVTLTATPAAGQVFQSWTVVDGSAEIDMADATAATTTFTMPEGSVSVKANYTSRAAVVLKGTEYSFTDSETKYFTTDNSGAIVESDAANYTIKLAYNKDVPTVYLKNANLSYVDSVIENGTDTPVFAIETEAPSTLHQTGNDTTDGAKETRGAVKTSGKVIFRGDALLTLNGNAHGIYGSNSAELLFEDANVAIARTGTWSEWYDSAFYGSIKSITFDGGTATVTAPRIFTQTTIIYNITGGANVSMKAPNSYLVYDGVSSTFNVEDGYLYLEGNTAAAMLAHSYVNVSENGVFEALNKNAGGTVSTRTPTYKTANHYVVEGNGKAAAEVYTGGAMDSRYFAIGKPVTVTAVGGTAQAFAESGTSITAIKGVDVTLTADAAPNGKVFAKWTANADATFANANATTTTFKPTGDVTVTATFSKQASVTIAGTARMVYQGLDAIYLTTNGGTVALGGNEDTYNIKFVYPEGENAVPVVYLRGAYLTQKITSNANTVIGTKIVVEKVGEYPTTVPEDIEADSYITVGINWGAYDLTISGYEGAKENPSLAEIGKLKMATGGAKCVDANAGYEITYKDLNLEVTTTSYAIGLSTKFDGGKASVVSDGSVYMIWASKDSPNTTHKGIIVTGGADVTLEGSGNTICIYYSTSAKITVEKDSKLKVVSRTSQAIRAPEAESSENVLSVNGGTLEISGTAAGYGATVVRPTGYDDNYFITINTTTTSATAVSLNSYAYFKVEPAYTLSVTEGTASVATDRVTVANATKAPVGATVTLTPATKPGNEFTEWTFGNGSMQPTIESNVFTMPAGPVGVVANYKKVAGITIGGTAYTFSDDKALYFTTDNGVLTEITEGDLENLYNVKLAYENDLPTVFLKNATITTTQTGIKNAANTPEFVIKTEAASTISQTDNLADSNGKYSAVNVTGQVTFKGSALLTLKGRESALYGNSSAKIIFEGANVNLEKTSGSDWGEAAISGSVSQITFSGGTVNIDSSYMALFCGTPTVAVQNRAIVIVECGSVFSWSGTYITVNDSTMNVRATNGNYRLFDGSESGNCTLAVANGGELEITSAGKILHTAPDLSNYQGEYYAVMGADVSTATKYNGTDALSGKYFRIGKKATVTVTDGTAKAFGESSAATEGTTHVLETMIGANVTLTAGTAPNGKEFFKWVDAASGETFTGVNTATGTFKLTGNVSVQAEFAYAATIELLGTAYKITEEVSFYFTTTDGAVTPIPAPQDGTSYNIKLAFDDKRVPTVYLKGATIVSKTSGVPILKNGTNVSEFKIVTQSDSRLDSFSNAIYMDRANLTFEGTGKLSLIGNNNPNSTAAFGGVATIRVDHYLNSDSEENKVIRTITLGENSDIYIKSNHFGQSGTAGIWAEPNITSNVVAKNGSALEIESTSNIVYAQIDLTFQDYANWAGVIGSSKEAATAYGGELNPNRESKYFKIAPGYQVSVTGGTATGVSSNGGRFLPGTTITLTPDAAATGKAFWQWATEDDIAIASNKFTMIDSNVSVDAEWQNKASIYLKAGRLYNILEKTPTYMKIVPDAGATVSTEDDYDLKLAYTENGEPAVYLKGAHMLSTTNEYCLTNGPDMDHLLIIVEEDSSMTSAGRGIYLNKADLTIRGPGKLTINSNTGGKTQYGNVAGILVASGNGSTITFASDADVEIYTHSEVIGQNDKGEDAWAYVACIWIENGVQPVTIENGAKVQLSSPSRVAYGSATLTIDAEYTDRVAIYGNNLATAPIFTGTSISGGKFFKIAPGYAVNVTNGTPSVTKALKGMNVTVTPNAAEENMGFAYWTSADVLGEGRYYENSYTFTMPVDEAISLTANYGEIAQVALRSKRYDTVKGGKAHYYTVTGNETITENGTADNYNISFVWEEGANAIPTLTLHNVSLDGTYEHGAVMNGPHMDDLIIRVSGVNNLTENQGGPGIRFSGNHLTIEGVYDAETQTYGTLNMSTNSQVLHFVAPNQYQPGYDAWDATEEHIVTINNVTMNMSGPGTAVFRIENKYDVYINNTVMNVTATGTNSAIYADSNSILQFNNSDVTLITPKNGVRLANSDLTINGGTFRVGTAENPVEAGFDLGDLIIADATVEVFASKHVYGAQGSGTKHIPNLDGYTFEYAAVLADTYDEFLANPEGHNYIAGSDMTGLGYFRIEPKVVQVQITWGAMSFTYNGSIWNVDTMSWEGNWEPDAGESEGLVSNQINVENIGTETVLVTFDFTAADAFVTAYAEIHGTFVDENDEAINEAYRLVRFAETDAFLKLNSVAVASFEDGTVLGTVTVVIDALTPAQGGNA